MPMNLNLRVAGAIAAGLLSISTVSLPGCGKNGGASQDAAVSAQSAPAPTQEGKKRAEDLVKKGDREFADGNYRAARDSYRAAVALDRTNVRARVGSEIRMVAQPEVLRARQLASQAKDLFKSGKKLEAHKILVDATNIDPNNREAFERAGDSARSVRRFDVAYSYFDQLAENFPSDPRPLAMGAQTAYEAKNYAKCLAYLDRLEPLMANSPELSRVGQIWFLKGIAAKQQGMGQDAIAALEKATKIEPNVPDFHDYLGRALLEEGKFDLAERCFLTVDKLKPNYAINLYHLGRARQRTARHQEAVDVLKRAYAIDNSQWVFLVEIARSYEALGGDENLLKATSYLDQALHRNPLSHEALLTYSSVLRKMGNTEESEKKRLRYEKISEVARQSEDQIRLLLRRSTQDPNDVSGYLEIIDIHTKFAHYEDAEDVVAKILAVQPHNIEAIAHSFRLCFQRNDLESAKWDAWKIVDYAPDDVRGPFYLATVFNKLGDHQSALFYAENALAKKTDDLGVLEILLFYYSRMPERAAEVQRLAPIHSRLKAEAERDLAEKRKVQAAWEKELNGDSK